METPPSKSSSACGMAKTSKNLFKGMIPSFKCYNDEPLVDWNRSFTVVSLTPPNVMRLNSDLSRLGVRHMEFTNKVSPGVVDNDGILLGISLFPSGFICKVDELG